MVEVTVVQSGGSVRIQKQKCLKGSMKKPKSQLAEAPAGFPWIGQASVGMMVPSSHNSHANQEIEGYGGVDRQLKYLRV